MSCLRCKKHFFGNRCVKRRKRQTTNELEPFVEQNTIGNVQERGTHARAISTHMTRCSTDEERKSVDVTPEEDVDYGWGRLSTDIVEVILGCLPESEWPTARLLNRHWAVAGRCCMRSLDIDTKHYAHRSQLSAYLHQLSHPSYHNVKQIKLTSVFENGYESLNRLTQVTALDLSGCATEERELAVLRDMTHLKGLTMGWTRLTDQGSGFLEDLVRLTSLNVEWCRMSEVALTKFAGMTSLSRLNVSGLECLTVDCLRPIALHRRLTHLDLSSMHLGDSSLCPVGALNQLIHLNLAMNPVTCAAMETVSQLTKLRKLSLKKTSVGNDGLRRLSCLVRLRRLNLSGTSVDDDGLQFLTPLGLLCSLDLSYNYMVGWNDLEYLMPLTSLIFLHSLNLQKTQANPTSAKALANRFYKKLRIEF